MTRIGQPRRCHRRLGHDERGSGTVVMMAVVLIVAMVAFVVACLIAWFGGMHRARAAADLSALAAGQAYAKGRDACSAAKSTAASNHATMTACTVESNGYDFIVTVSVQVAAQPQLVFGPDHFSAQSHAGNLNP